MSIDVLEDYPAGNRMQGLCVSLSKDNITVSGCTLKEEKKKKKEKQQQQLCLGRKKKKAHIYMGVVLIGKNMTPTGMKTQLLILN